MKTTQEKIEPKQQIKVLKRVLLRLQVERLFFKYSDGLCFMLYRELKLKIPDQVETFIPLFCIENAEQFGAKKRRLWWNRKDFKSRIKFVKWMIKQLQQ